MVHPSRAVSRCPQLTPLCRVINQNLSFVFNGLLSSILQPTGTDREQTPCSLFGPCSVMVCSLPCRGPRLPRVVPGVFWECSRCVPAGWGGGHGTGLVYDRYPDPLVCSTKNSTFEICHFKPRTAQETPRSYPNRPRTLVSSLRYLKIDFRGY